MRTCYILCGISGSGKSTYAKKHLPQAIYFSADTYFVDKTTGEYNFDVNELGDAHNQCLRFAIDEFRYGKYDVVIDNTNTTVVEIAPYAACAVAWGYKAQVILLQCRPEVGIARNVHKVPESVVRAQAKRLESLEDSLPPRWPLQVIPAT